MRIWDTYPDNEPYDPDALFVSPLAKHTAIGWQHILRLCQQQVHIGFGALDSFLSGPDLDHRIDLIEHEAKTNAWLKAELRDVLIYPQQDWKPEQLARIKKIV